MVYVVRRNHWGEKACEYLQQEWPELKIINKDQQAIPVDDWAIRWATTSNLPGNPKVINKASAIHTVYDKGGFRKKMADAGFAPETYTNIDAFERANRPMEQGWVVRANNHAKGADLWICTQMRQVKAAVKQCLNGYYISEFIDKDREYRVYLVSGRIVAMIEKHPEDQNDVAWGLGGDWDYIRWNNWPLDVCRVSSGAFKLSGLDFGAADVISKGKKAYVLEINTGPEITPYYGHQFAKGIRYMIERNDRSFIEPAAERSYRSYIHPALEN